MGSMEWHRKAVHSNISIRFLDANYKRPVKRQQDPDRLAQAHYAAFESGGESDVQSMRGRRILIGSAQITEAVVE